MKKVVILWSILLLALGAAAQIPDTLDRPRELQVRGGLPNFFKKLARGGQLTIAYFGGSITEAGGGWRDQSFEWLQRRFPQAQLRQVNAGVGGTGSDLGVFRLRRDVLAQHPDLVFVEFAVNDGGQPSSRIHETMEGIVRQIWQAGPKTDICFIYTLSGDMVDTLQRGHLWRSMRAMEDIAAYYQIPTVQYAPEVLKRLRAGTLIFKGDPRAVDGPVVFSQDNVHPLPQTGHRIYAEVLERCLPKLEQGQPLDHRIGRPYVKTNWEKAQMLPVSVLKRSGQWEVLTDKDSVAKNFRMRFPVTLKTTTPGASLSVRFKGRIAGLYDIIGPGCGQALVTKDDSLATLVPRFDAFAWYYRTNYFLLPFRKNKRHTVTWALSPAVMDKNAVLKPMGHEAKPPARFAENAIYGGWLLLVGELKPD